MRAAYWWIDRWLKSTAYADLTLEEQGAYRNLLDQLWLRGGVLPNDERVLGKCCGDAIAWPRIRDRVMARFTLTPEGWRNETHDEVAGASDRYLASQAAKGKKRAENATRNGGRFTSPPAEAPADNQPGHQPGHQPRGPAEAPAAHQPPGPGPGPGLGQGPGMGFFETLPAGAGTKVKKARVVSPQDAAARRLAKILGSSLNVCRAQVGALVAKGATVVSVEQAITEHAEPGMKPWDWTRKVAGGGGGALTGDQIRALGARWEEQA